MIAIYARSNPDNISEEIKKLIIRLHGIGKELIVYAPFYAFLKQNSNLELEFQTYSDHTDIKGAECLISLGGDGTILETLTLVRDSGIPIMGINTGRLGFLASISEQEIDFAIEALSQKKYIIDKRMLLKLETNQGFFPSTNYALNEITIVKKDSTMMTIHTQLDGAFLNSYWADGLIVSTPTGSTAYSLSCGGPVVMPDSKSFIITPIAPHNLNVRPLIVADDKVLSLKIEGRSPSYLITLDSRSHEIAPNTEIRILKEKFHINLIRFENHDFFNTLRNKLMWGVDKRN